MRISGSSAREPFGLIVRNSLTVDLIIGFRVMIFAGEKKIVTRKELCFHLFPSASGGSINGSLLLESSSFGKADIAIDVCVTD